MSAIVDALLSELDDQSLARLASRLRPYLEPTADSGAPLLTADETAALLRCKRKRVYELAQRGSLPTRRDGGRVLFHRDDVDAYLKQHRSAAASPRPSHLPTTKENP